MTIRHSRDERRRRRTRVRAKVSGTAPSPRLSVFRSTKHIYAQLIDDEAGVTLVAATDLGRGGAKVKTKAPKDLTSQRETAWKVGYQLAQEALGKGITKVVFDRGGYKYHGRVKALAEGARGGGLVF